MFKSLRCTPEKKRLRLCKNFKWNAFSDFSSVVVILSCFPKVRQRYGINHPREYSKKLRWWDVITMSTGFIVMLLIKLYILENFEKLWGIRLQGVRDENTVGRATRPNKVWFVLRFRWKPTYSVSNFHPPIKYSG